MRGDGQNRPGRSRLALHLLVPPLPGGPLGAGDRQAPDEARPLRLTAASLAPKGSNRRRPIAAPQLKADLSIPMTS
jgi:hypothetical protein